MIFKLIPQEVTKIISSEKISWSKKAEIVSQFFAQYNNTKQVSKLLKRSEHFVTDCILLNDYCITYPRLSQIWNKSFVLSLIRRHLEQDDMLIKIEERIKYEQSQTSTSDGIRIQNKHNLGEKAKNAKRATGCS